MAAQDAEIQQLQDSLREVKQESELLEKTINNLKIDIQKEKLSIVPTAPT